MQETQLHHDPEQKTAAGKDPAEEILQVLPKAHFA
jgi:hypothetical protein